MAPWPCTFPSSDPRSRCMRCTTLRDACTDFLPAPNASAVYGGRPGRGTLANYQHSSPLRIHVAGMSRTELLAALGNAHSNIGAIRDPLNSEFLRHLERDIVLSPAREAATPLHGATPSALRRLGHRRTKRSGAERRVALLASRGTSSSSGGGENLTMIWPLWEMGFGDVIANTLLPLGELLRMGSMPRNLALSGLRHPPLLQLLRPAVGHLCASERAHRHLPRCASRCWHAVHICAPVYTDTRDAWAALRALDEKAGIAPSAEELAAARRGELLQRQGGESTSAAVAPVVPRPDVGGGSSGGVAAVTTRAQHTASTAVAQQQQQQQQQQQLRDHRDRTAGGDGGAVLRVLFAARSGRRLMLNVQTLASACDGSVVRGINSDGGGSVRLRCEVLSALATPSAKAWQLRRADVLVCVWGGDTLHGLHLRRGGAIIELRLAGFIMGAPWSWVDMHRRWVVRFNGKPAERPLSFYAVTLPTNSSALTGKDRRCLEDAERLARRQPRRNKRWQCYWNADLHVPYASVHAALERLVADRARGVRSVVAEGDVCSVRRRGGVLIEGRYTCPP